MQTETNTTIDVPEKIIREYASYDDGWPGYEEPSVDVNSL